MSATDRIEFWQEGGVGRLHLNRPEALNALSYDMTLALKTKLEAWRDDPSIDMVLIDAEGDRAFCAGGDVRELYESGRESPDTGRDFWRNEYKLNHLIATYPKPYIALIDGISMGGGVGISSHGSHRIVTERTMLAMPETAIGFMPDVGTSYILSRAPGKTGLYLGMTGARMDAGDAIFAGFADHYIESGQLQRLVELLVAGTLPDEAIQTCALPQPVGFLSTAQDKISTGFGGATVLDCLYTLAEMAEAGDEWAQMTHKLMRQHSPLSIATTFAAINQAEHCETLGECLAIEYRFAHRVLLLDEFYEGVRAAVVDKDKTPKWSPAKLEDVRAEMVSHLLSPLGDEEWQAT